MQVKVRNPSRRDVLAGGAAMGATSLPLLFHRHAYGAAFTNTPGNAKSVLLGFAIPRTGPYADEGADELRAFNLAVRHLNGEGDGGMLNSMKPLHLTGNGILGKKIDYVVGDTQSNGEAARSVVRRMIEKDGAIMISGGSSSSVAIALQNLCQDAGIIFMAGLTHSNDTTGKHRRRYGFRHFFNAYMSGAALAPILAREYGSGRNVYHLTSDYTWGWTQEESIRKFTEMHDWQTVISAKTPFGTVDFSQYLTPVFNSGADVLVLNQYGQDLINSLSQVAQFGLRDKQVNGRSFEIVVPLFSRLMAQGAGESIKGILGSANWNWKLKDFGSQAFVRSFGQEFGFPPSMAAHTCYVQTLLYADACERAGTFYPPEVIKALEGHEFSGMGNGVTEYRAEDHQCFKDVLIVRGNENPVSQFDLLNVVEITPRAQIEYDAHLFGGDLGPYKK